MKGTGGGLARNARFLASLVPAALLLVGFMAVAGFLSSRFRGGVGVAVGLVAGACLALGLLLGYWISTDRLNLRLIRRSLSEGETALRDGEVAAFAGVVSTDAPPLIAPFSDLPCAAYTYVVSTSRPSASRGGSQRLVLAQGFHLAPTRIEGARRSLRLGSLPAFEDELRHNARGGPWGRKARELVLRMAGRAGSADERERQSRLLEARHTVVEEVHQDYCMSAAPESGDALVIDEEALPVGGPVCVVGTYDAERNALTARRSRLGANLMVYRGSPDEVLSRVGGDTAAFGRAAIVLLGLGTLLVSLPFLPETWTARLPLVGSRMVPPVPEAARSEEATADAAFKARIDGLVREQHRAGNPVRALELALEQNAHESLQWLIDQGVSPSTRLLVAGDSYQLPLVAAVRMGHLETVRTLLRAGADPNQAEPPEGQGKPGRTALTETLLMERCDIARLLIEAGAQVPPGLDHTPCP